MYFSTIQCWSDPSGEKKCLQRWWEHDKLSLPEPITVKIPSQEAHFLSGNHLRERCSFFQLKQNRLTLHTEIPCTVKCAPEITQTMKFSISRSMAQVLSKIVNGPVLKEETATYNKPCYRHDVSHELKRPIARLASCIGKYMSHARVQSDTSTNCKQNQSFEKVCGDTLKTFQSHCYYRVLIKIVTWIFRTIIKVNCHQWDFISV